MRKEAGKLKVLMVAARYFPYIGGTETHIYEVGRRLVREGINVTLLTTAPYAFSTPFPREESTEGMSVIRVRAWLSSSNYYVAPEIYAIVQQGHWDLVHCQGSHTFVSPLAMLAAKKANLPYVVTFHTGGHSSFLRVVLRATQWRVQRPLLASAARLIAVSRFEAEYFRTLLGLPTRLFSIIPNGVDLPSLPDQLPATAVRPLIVSVGRLERYKGHHRLIEALPEIHRRCPNARLLILGKGPYEANLYRLARRLGVTDDVEIRSVPAGDRHAMANELSQAAVVALLSNYEAHPIAVMEALALQRPVLVAATSGLREIAEQGLARAVLLNSTPAEIAEAVSQQLEHPLIPPAHLTLPTWDECIQQLQAVYAMVLREDACVF